MTTTDLLLIALIVLLAVRIYQAHRQHERLIQWIDAFAEMIGEAIDSWRKGQ